MISSKIAPSWKHLTLLGEEIMFLKNPKKENQFSKSQVDAVLHHMLDRKRKNNILPYAELRTKILHCTSYPYVEEEPIYKRIMIRHVVIRKMGQ
ncbi:hypothetical protein RYX36_002345, partial [Vicia faba]